MALLAGLVHPWCRDGYRGRLQALPFTQSSQKSVCDAGLRVLEQPGQVMCHLLLPLADVSELLLDLLKQPDNPLIRCGFLALSHRRLLFGLKESSLRPTNEPVRGRADA